MANIRPPAPAFPMTFGVEFHLISCYDFSRAVLLFLLGYYNLEGRLFGIDGGF